MSDYWYLSACGRRTGKTTAICKAAKEIGATVIVHSVDEAKRVSREHGVKAASIQQNLRGTTGPYLIDPHAAGMKLSHLAEESERLHSELDQALKDNRALEGRINGLQLALDEARKNLFEQGERNDRTRSEVLRVAAERNRARAWAKRWKEKTKGYRTCLNSQESYLQVIENEWERYLRALEIIASNDAKSGNARTLCNTAKGALDGKEGA